MFRSCINLKNLDLTSFDVRNSGSFEYMFEHCSELTNIDLSSFKFANRALNFTSMFANCAKLATLDLSAFNVKNTNANVLVSMFENCTNLTRIYANSDFMPSSNLTEAYVGDTFKGLTKLESGLGHLMSAEGADSKYRSGKYA
jgi:surface protein